jgi:bacterial/archaeal transporter family protein
VVIFIFAWSVALLTRHQPIASLGKRTWLFLILSGLATGLSWLCYFRALQLGEASQVAPVDKLSVVIAIALAAIFLHERVTWIHWVGGLLIVSGSIILAYA